MSTRLTKSKVDGQSISMGYEGTDVPEDFSIPECTIEDVDRALFDLFNKEIPFYYTLKDATRKTPVIFATGERFAILRRNRPLRDKAGILILPLISMVRTGIEQDATKGAGPGQTQPLVIKKRLSKRDPRYQQLINKVGVHNQDNTVSLSHRNRYQGGISVTGSLPGTVASRRIPTKPSMAAQQNMLLANNLNNKNIYEFITIPPVKHYTATYEITFWTQYTQQMNNMLTALMSVYQDMHQRTFRIETSKGYWFVAYVQPSLNSDNNFTDFSDQERIVKYSFSIDVPAYIVNPSYPGAPNALRSFLSAPEISFDILQANVNMTTVRQVGPPSGDVGKYVLENMATDTDALPGTRLLGKNGKAASDSTNIVGGVSALHDDSVNIGGAMGGRNNAVSVPFLGNDPFTGETYEVPLPPVVSTSKGESIYVDISTGNTNPGLETLTEIDI